MALIEYFNHAVRSRAASYYARAFAIHASIINFFGNLCQKTAK